MAGQKIILTGILAGLLLMATGTAAPPAGTPDGEEMTPAIIDYSQWIDANHMLMFVSNEGILASDEDDVFGYTYGLFYPFSGVEHILDGTQTTSVMYATGLWMGGIDAVTGDTLVCIAEYSSEYVPGPAIGGTYPSDAYTNPDYRVYKLYADSMGGNPNAGYLNWPVAQGAPLDDQDQPLLYGWQTLWTVFTDFDPNRHLNNAGYTDPLGIEVQQTVLGFADELHRDMVFVKYKIINRGTRTLNGAYFSLWADPDVGSSWDDNVGCDSLLSIGYAYNGEDEDGQFGVAAPAVGWVLLQGPAVPG